MVLNVHETIASLMTARELSHFYTVLAAVHKKEKEMSDNLEFISSPG